MTTAIAILIVIAFLFGGTAGVLAILVVGIHKGDRANSLADRPSTPIEAITRRVLGVGVLNENSDHDRGED